jgi:hypothetical protein
MSKKVSITLDDEVLDFVDRLASNRSRFINDVLWQEKKRVFMKELEDAYKDQAIDILAAVKRTAIPKPHDLGFCFCPEGFFAPALTDLLCSGLIVAPQTDTASPAAKIFLLALISRSW